MIISKEERAELRRLLGNVADNLPLPWEESEQYQPDGSVCLTGEVISGTCPYDTVAPFLDKNACLLTIAAVNAAPRFLDALDASDERIASLEDTLRSLGERDDQLTLELASAFHNLATNVVEAVGHAVLQGRVLDGAKARIAELEAAAQWRPMDTAPRDGTWILVLLSPDLQGKTDYSAASILSFHHDPFADYWRNVHWDKWNDGAGYGWLPIPALPEGGAK